MEREKARSRKKKPLGIKLFAAVGGGIIITAAAIAAVVYIQVGKQYQTVYFPNTTINGVDASKRTVEEVKQMIASGIDGYTLTLEERDGKSEVIAGEAIGLESVFDGSLEKLLADQDQNRWYEHRNAPQTFEIATMIQYDQAKFEEVTGALACFDEENIIKPQDAYLSDYVSGQGYAVIPSVLGNEPDQAKVVEAISDAVMNLKETLSLEELDAYRKPAVTEEDPALVQRAQDLNRLVNVTVTYTFGDSREVLNGDTISSWTGIGEDGSVYLDSGKVTEYVKGLASKYDTYNKAKTLKTSYGPTVKISGGMYGWRINQAQEADELSAIIRSGESQTREPVYKQKAASHGSADYGSTYVEINLTAQHLYYYKDGKLITQSDFVSGNEAKGWSTPAGVYPLTYKERNATLKGEDYRTPVDYWMPFNGGIGMHDATWRSSFGGTIYKNSGSHGCVNLPHSVAQTIFENISSGTPVLCYHLDGTGSKAASGSSGKPAETTAAPAETTAAPAETTAASSGDTPGGAETTASSNQPGDTLGGAPETTASSNQPGDTPGGGSETTAVQQPGDTSGGGEKETTAANRPAETSPASGSEKGPGVGPGGSDTGTGEIGPGM